MTFGVDSIYSAGRPPALTAAQARYVRRAARLRGRLSNKALAERFGVHDKTISAYISEKQKKLRPKNIKPRVRKP